MGDLGDDEDPGEVVLMGAKLSSDGVRSTVILTMPQPPLAIELPLALLTLLLEAPAAEAKMRLPSSERDLTPIPTGDGLRDLRRPPAEAAVKLDPLCKMLENEKQTPATFYFDRLTISSKVSVCTPFLHLL